MYSYSKSAAVHRVFWILMHLFFSLEESMVLSCELGLRERKKEKMIIRLLDEM